MKEMTIALTVDETYKKMKLKQIFDKMRKMTLALTVAETYKKMKVK